MIVLALLVVSQAATGPLSQADMAAFRASLRTPVSDTTPLVSFRSLWDGGDRLMGKPVTVVGRVARRFSQEARGEWPPLTELWLVDEAGNPVCVTCREGAAPVGRRVRVRGVVARRLRYRSGDGDRMAPWIVAAGGPVVEVESRDAGTNGLTWAVAAGMAVVAGAVLAVQHARGPRRRPVEGTPAPVFGDGQGADDGR